MFIVLAGLAPSSAEQYRHACKAYTRFVETDSPGDAIRALVMYAKAHGYDAAAPEH